MSNEVTKGVAFVLVSIGVIALAGPLPTAVNGVLVLVISGVILQRYVGVANLSQWITQQLGG